MVPFDATYYSSAIVSIVPLSSYLTLNNIVTLNMGKRSLKIIESGTFESLCKVSYSPFISTMAISLTVCETFSVKEWRNLENWVTLLFKVIENGAIR